jgi:hypothetical protein
VRKGGGPSIFEGNTSNNAFDVNMYLFNNPDVKTARLDPVKHYKHAQKAEQDFRTSQFKVYDLEKTWKRIEERNYEDSSEHARHDYFPNTYYGTFFSWNNAPRRNFTNKQYWNYPHMFDKVDTDAFTKHLYQMKKKAEHRKSSSFLSAQSTLKDKFFFLTAWNEWNEQSLLEPSDIDGYDALMAVKEVFKPPQRRGQSSSAVQTIVHVGHRGGGTEKHIGDLIKLFSEYHHRYISSHELESLSADPASTDVVLIHLHSAMVGAQAIAWKILDVLPSYCSGADKRCYLTVHDYQWLFPENPNPSLEYLATVAPNSVHVQNCRRLFAFMDHIIYPTRFLRSYYMYILYKQDVGDLIANKEMLTDIQALLLKGPNAAFDMLLSSSEGKLLVDRTSNTDSSQSTKHVVVGHNDLLVSHNYLSLPTVRQHINLAFVGNFHQLKGSDTFLWLTKNLESVEVGGRSYRIQYHIFGRAMEFDTNCQSSACVGGTKNFLNVSGHNIIFHGEYEDSKLESLMKKHEVHAITMLSTFPETWCYALSAIFNMGVPLVYFNQGSFLDRVPAFLHYKDRSLSGADSVDVQTVLQHSHMHMEDYEDFFVQRGLNKYFPVAMSANGYSYDTNTLVSAVKNTAAFVLAHANQTEGFQRQSKNVQPRKWYLLNYPHSAAME